LLIKWHLFPHLSYEALGLLTSIPLSQSATASSSKPSSQPLKDADLISGFGRIVRDAEGNVIDVILPEDDEEAAAEDSEDEDELDVGGKIVPAKTEVVKSETMILLKGSSSRSFSIQA
jgi:nucleolar protein 16